MKSHMLGHILIGLQSEHIPSSLMVRQLPAFREQYPHIRLSVVSESMEMLEAGLISDRLHIVLTTDQRESDFLQSIPAGTLAYTAVAAPDYLRQRGVIDKVEKLLLTDIIDIAAHMPLLTQWVGSTDLDLVAILTHIKPAIVVPRFSAALDLVRAGCGVSFLPRRICQDAIDGGELVEIKVGHPVPSRPLALLYRRKSSRPLVEAVFLEHLLDNLPLS